MAIHYSEEYIDELLKRVNLMELMRKHGITVRAGAEANHFYVASWCCGKTDMDNGRIRKTTQTYKCMACLEQGNAIHFLRQAVGMTFQEAIEELAAFTGTDMPVPDKAAMNAQKRKEAALQLAADFYYDQKYNEYLLARGISPEILDKCRAGYAPGGRALRSYLEKAGYTKDELREYKLINHKGLDSFFYRAVIPVIMRGKVTDLYGRATAEKNAGIKHFYLYGDDILGGVDQIDPHRLVLVYEAAIDRLVAESHGFDNGVDSGGASKFTKDHARLLRKKGVSKALVVYDGDKAGRAGSLHTGQLLAEEGILVWIAELQAGMDPAEILQQFGAEAFTAQIHSPKTYEQYMMHEQLAKYKLEDIENYIQAMKEAAAARSLEN